MSNLAQCKILLYQKILIAENTGIHNLDNYEDMEVKYWFTVLLTILLSHFQIFLQVTKFSAS